MSTGLTKRIVDKDRSGTGTGEDILESKQTDDGTADDEDNGENEDGDEGDVDNENASDSEADPNSKPSPNPAPKPSPEPVPDLAPAPASEQKGGDTKSSAAPGYFDTFKNAIGFGGGNKVQQAEAQAGAANGEAQSPADTGAANGQQAQPVAPLNAHAHTVPPNLKIPDETLFRKVEQDCKYQLTLLWDYVRKIIMTAENFKKNYFALSSPDTAGNQALLNQYSVVLEKVDDYHQEITHRTYWNMPPAVYNCWLDVLGGRDPTIQIKWMNVNAKKPRQKNYTVDDFGGDFANQILQMQRASDKAKLIIGESKRSNGDVVQCNENLDQYASGILMTNALITILGDKNANLSDSESGQFFTAIIMCYASAQLYETQKVGLLKVKTDTKGGKEYSDYPWNEQTQEMVQAYCPDDTVRKYVYGLIEEQLQSRFGLVILEGQLTTHSESLTEPLGSSGRKQAAKQAQLWKDACSKASQLALLEEMHNVVLLLERRQSREGDTGYSLEEDEIPTGTSDAIRIKLLAGRKKVQKDSETGLPSSEFKTRIDKVVDFTIFIRNLNDSEPHVASPSYLANERLDWSRYPKTFLTTRKELAKDAVKRARVDYP